MKEALIKKSDKDSLSVLALPTVARQTIHNYKILSSCHEYMKIMHKAQKITEGRYHAQISFMSTICFIMTISRTHLLIGQPDKIIIVNLFVMQLKVQ